MEYHIIIVFSLRKKYLEIRFRWLVISYFFWATSEDIILSPFAFFAESLTGMHDSIYFFAKKDIYMHKIIVFLLFIRSICI